MADTPEEIHKHMRTYWKVGAVLLICTALTVIVAEITHSITVGLGLAAFKAALVALIFMHLNAERPLIYQILAYTVFFAIGMMFLTVLALYDPLVSR